jgi:ATP-dependent helicase HrpB
VPPALIGDGRVILLQPRRVAARAIASRIAGERGWTVGREVGWQIRFDRRFSAETRLLVATEGILTARLQSDPLLSDFHTIVLDEFHERSLHADLAIALAKQAWRARDDLRIVVMSATLDTAAVAAYLDNCPVVEVPGRHHPIETIYAPETTMVEAVARTLERTDGDALCFLPGAFEIRQAQADLERRFGPSLDVVPLYGSLDADDQDRVMRLSSRRRVVVATNIAETSVTVPGVTAVVDSGLHKIARYDADRGIDSLDVERITMDSADQRAGRAGRIAPGIAVRLWDSRDRLRPHREPEIHRVDLCGAALEVVAWGGDPRRFEWFDPPRGDALDAALSLLERLGLVSEGRLTHIGRRVHQLPLHPRLGRMLAAADGARDVARACAILSERHLLPPRSASTASDLLPALDAWQSMPAHVRRVAEDVARAFGGGAVDRVPDEVLGGAVLAGYPDRVAERRAPGSPRVRMASGTGALVARESGVVDGQFLVALDVHESGRRDDPEARIRLATRIERDWLVPTAVEIVHRFDEEAGVVRAFRVARYDALVLSEQPVTPDLSIAATMLTKAWIARGPGAADSELLRRARFAGCEIDVEEIVRRASASARSIDDIRIAGVLARELRVAIDRDAPETLRVPSGRSVPLAYAADGTVSASVKLQELFGLADTPRIGPRREPVVLSLLAPNGRPVQVTRDLRSFWDRTYPEVRRELRGRYPKHPWPEDPWSAVPTRRTKGRG